MLETLYEVSHFAPLVIGVAAFLDIFFLSGLLLYGFATLGTIGMMHATGMITAPEIAVAALAGTLLGNQVNYWVGRLFHTTTFVQKRLASARAQKAKGFLRSRGLFVFIIVGNFVTFFRPLYGLVLGGFKISYRRFMVYEVIISTIWVLFWLVLLLYGEKLYLDWTANLLQGF